MHTPEVVETDYLLKFSKGFLASLRAAQVVAGREGVAGIKTDSNPAFVLNLVNDLGKMLKLPPQVTALTGRILYHRNNPLCLLQGQVNGLGNAGKAVGYPDLAKMAARVKIKPVKPKLHTPGHFVVKGLAGLFQPFRFRVAKVDQVTVVGKYLVRLVAVVFTALFEQLNTFL